MQSLDPQLATILFAVALTVHNVEEAIWLPAFGRETGARDIDPTDFRVAVAIFTLGAYAICASSLAWRSPVLVCALAGLGATMALNGFLPHLAATIRFRRYAPGTATGLVLDLPAGVALVVSLEAAGWVSRPVLWWALPVSVVAIAAFTVALPHLLSRARTGIRG